MKLLSRVRLFATPWTVTYQAPQSMEFSRQEYWSGLPLPSPTFSDELKWSEVAQSCPTLCDPMNCSLPGSSIHGVFQARVLEWVAISSSRGSSQPRDWTRVSRIAGRHFTIWATTEAPSLWKILNKYFRLMKIVIFTFTSSLRHCDPIKWLVFRLWIN